MSNNFYWNYSTMNFISILTSKNMEPACLYSFVLGNPPKKDSIGNYEKLLEVMLGNGLVSELAYRFPLLLSWLTWVAASIVCLLVALVACLKWFLLSEWEIKETFSTMVFQGYLYYLITPTSNNQVLKYYVIILWGFSWDPYLKTDGTRHLIFSVKDPKLEYMFNLSYI